MGYEHGWAVWSVSGRLNGWGVGDMDENGTATEGFMDGVKDLVSSS